MSTASKPAPGEPFCGACGYVLSGLTESSRCPECGRPLVEVLQRGPHPMLRNRRYQSNLIVFGLPLIDIALGPGLDGRPGKAKGIIAIGDVAAGWLAIGGVARGIIAFGGMAFGLVALGGFAIGGAAFGGGAIGLIAAGGGVIGGMSFGGGAVGVVASGGGAAGHYARGGGVRAKYAISPVRRDPEAVAVFRVIDQVLLLPDLSRIRPRQLFLIYTMVMFWAVMAVMMVGLPLALVVWLAVRRARIVDR